MGRKAIIDRFEGDWAVLELDEDEFMDVARANLPLGAKEGSIILIDDEGEITLLEKETQDKRDEVEELMERLFE